MQSESKPALVVVTDAMVVRALNAYHRRGKGPEYDLSKDGLLRLYPELFVAMKQALKEALNPPRHEHTSRCYDAFAKPDSQQPDCGFESLNA